MSESPTDSVTTVQNWPLEQVVEKLTYFRTRPSLATIEQARLHRKAITPILMDALRRAAKGSAAVDDDHNLHISALYLLAEFREKEAYPFVVELLSLDRAEMERLLGDVDTEDGSRILASVSRGDIRAICQLAETAVPAEISRWTALSALVVLVGAGELARKDALQYFSYLMRNSTAPPKSEFWIGLTMSATDLHPTEIAEDIQGLYERGLADTGWDTWEHIEEMLKRPREEVLSKTFSQRHYQMLTDAHHAMEWMDPVERYVSRAPVAPKRRSGPEPGRNDPCWCGSGQKYKKCCLKKQ